MTVDGADPQSLAGFWTAALSTTVASDYGEFVLPAGAPTPGLWGTVLADPEGNEFCVVSHRG